MEEADQRLRQAIRLIIESGYQLDAKALTFLKDLTQRVEIEAVVKKTIEELATLPERPLFLTKKFLEANVIEASKTEVTTQTVVESVSQTFKPYAREVEVLDDPTESK